MKKTLFSCRLFLGLLLIAVIPPIAFADTGVKKLSLDECISLTQSAFKPALAAEWNDYLPYTKVCPLRKTRATDVAVFLVSVFIEDYYKAKPDEKVWKKFPFPLLVSAEERCLARLPTHFPYDQPVDLTLRFGHWRNNIPTEIIVDVKNPTVGGDYQLPKLFWDGAKRKYIARKNTDRNTIKEMECPA